jgi:hypothetical protein
MTSESPSQLVAQLQERVSRLEEELQQYRAPKIDSNAPPAIWLSQRCCLV